ncbi:bifunctional 2',3'-cyclic-nucleotide 2'-phosphodiesterase/3'-nucleotidase [Bacillus sp. BGMRC 2118]|nr:bifunctional 2',3'-cyclic-nucleotide 2'-phosphodiesterase/3'-nucleotidase [Bacillus sp. BGMRC 2118]
MKRKIRRHIQRKMLNGTLAAALVASTIPATFAPTVAKAEGTTPVAESVVDLRILETTDVHGMIMDYDYYQDKSTIEYGLARTAELIKEARIEEPNNLLFDNGDLLQGNPLTDYVAKIKKLGADEVHPIFKVYNLLKYDAATLGNHEFNYGLPFLDNALEEANFPYVNANVYEEDNDSDNTNDKHRFEPYKIIDKTVVDENGVEQHIKVGVIGLVTPQIMQWDKANLEGQVKVEDIVTTAEKYVPQMKAEGADIVVALAHTGYDSAAEAGTGAENAVLPLSKVEGIDAILFGHKHVVFPGLTGTGIADGKINGVAAVEAGNWGNNLGVVDLRLEKVNDTWTVASSQTAARSIFKSYKDAAGKTIREPLVDGADAEVVAAIKEAHDGTLDYVRGEIGQTTAPMYSYFARVQDDPTIQIVNNAQTWYVEKYIAEKLPEYKDVPVLSAGAPFKAGRQGISDYTNIETGTLSIKSANDLYLYPNTLKAVELTGAQVKEWLEMSAGQFKQLDPNSTDTQELINYSFEPFNFDVIDGVKYEIDVTQPAKYNLDGTVADASASRIKNLTMPDGTPVDLNQKFVVVTNNYRASGGGNFPGLAGSKLVVDSADENRQILMDYITEQGTINPSADQNWKVVSSNKNTKVTFRSSPNAVGKITDNPHITSSGTNADGWGLYEMNLDQLVAEEPVSETVNVQLLGINDLHGQLDTVRTVKDKEGNITSKSGSIEYLAAYLKQREATNPNNTLMLHAGDAVGASAPVSALLQDEPTIRFLNEIGFDAGTIGNHEFDEGVGEMLRLINGGEHPKTVEKYGAFEGADFPYVAANVQYKDSKELILDPYTIKEVDGVKVGIIGVVTTGTPNIVIPSMVENVEFTDEVTAINKYAQELKDKGVKSIVVLAHNPGLSNRDGSNATGEVVTFANAVDDEVDVIFGGHDHKYLNAVVDNKLLVQSYSYGTAFSDVDLVIDRATGDVVTKTAEIVDTTHANITPDAEVKAQLDEYKEAIAPIINEVIGYTDVELTRTPSPSGEQVLGNVIADSMRAEMDTDMAFMNPGGIRNDIDAGEITWGELFNVQPFGNDLIKMTVTGDVIRELLNQQWADPTRAKMLQISGLFYTYDDSLDYGSRILDIYLENGEEIDPAGEYTITVNNFMAGGGDGYGALLKGTDKLQGPTDLDAFVKFIKNNELNYTGYEDRFLKVDSSEELVGWQFIDNTWYYINPETGEVETGWFKVDGKWYFSDNEGAMKTGWIKLGKTWYYLDKVNGDMKTGWVKLGKTWYYLDSVNGDMKTGWIKLGKTWYFLDKVNGDMKKGWVLDGKKWYYLKNDGSMAQSTVVSGYKFGADGAWIK